MKSNGKNIPPDYSVIGAVVNFNKPGAERALMKLHDRIIRKNGTLMVYCGKHKPKAFLKYNCTARALARQAHLVVVLGGDGTMLLAASILKRTKTPVFGVNIGHLGFLSETSAKEMIGTLNNIFSGNYSMDTRMMLDFTVMRGDKTIAVATGLNEGAIVKNIDTTTVLISTYIGGKLMSRFRGDGYIIATPTGSTAYALSAGGPVVSPKLDACIIIPISPHAIAVRPMVLGFSEELTIFVDDMRGKVALTVDGLHTMVLQKGDRISVKRSEYMTHMIRCQKRGFYDIIVEKLRWLQR